MGAWNHSLVGNDIFQDERYQLEQCTFQEAKKHLEYWHKLAQMEAATMWLDESHLPLDFNEEVDRKEEFLFNEEQTTQNREIFCGLVDHILRFDNKYLPYLTKSQIQDSIMFAKQLGSAKHIMEWSEPNDRIKELFEFNQRVVKYLKKI